MGLTPLALGLAMGGASAASTLLSGFSENRQAKANAQAQEVQAENIRRQAEIAKQQGELEVQAKDKERAALTRQYQEMQGKNAVSLGAGNVDASTGSALAVADGNASAFASDIGDNAYSRANLAVSNLNQYRASTAQAANLDAQASAAKSRSLFPTLLGTALSGASGFMSGYSFGGKFPGAKK